MGVPPAEPPGCDEAAMSRETPAGTGPGHPYHPEATRPQGCGHHHDLHVWAQPGAAQGIRPSRHSVTDRAVRTRTR